MPATPWPIHWLCDVSTESPVVTAASVLAATEILWSLSGRQFGVQEFTFRPRRYPYQDTPWGPGGWLDWSLGIDWSVTSWPFPSALIGECSGGSEIKLPEPISSVTEVRINGNVLAPTNYRVDDNRFLIRLDAAWPYRNNLALPDTVAGTWSIKAQLGRDIPASAQFAMGELACEFIRGWNGADCRLPRNITTLARQGISITMPDTATAFANGRTGLYLCDAFIAAVNPNGLRQRARVYRVDDAGPYRRTGT